MAKPAKARFAGVRVRSGMIGCGFSFWWVVFFANSISLFLVCVSLSVVLDCGSQFLGQLVGVSGLKCAVISLFWPYLLGR